MQGQDEPSPEAADDGDATETSLRAAAHNSGDAHDEAEATPDEVPSDTDDAGELAEETSDPTAAPSDDEDLPEWEPLTPELVEDEAIRGDFMLHWAAILLALLMGWTIIQDTAVLTHIKSGQHLAENGWLPSATDVFSSSATGHRWVNLSWLWDLTLAGVYGVAGAWGVSLLKAVLSAATFWLLLRISLPGLPTWWGSVCAVLALVAAFPSLTATPAVMTLLGTVCLIYLLHRWMLEPQNRSLWPVAVLLLVWCQFDDRAWIGAATLVSFTIGHWFDCRRNLGEAKPAGIRPLAMVTFCSLAAMLVHPFLWETLLSPIGLYQLEYPSLQTYVSRDVPYLYERYPLWSSQFWTDVNYFNGAGFLLWLVALVTLVLNRRRLRCSQLGVFLVMTGVACAGGRELAVAGIVNAALATVNAQHWYRASFRQSYSLETSELLFSRGGRAMTVAAFFTLGFAMVSGHLTGADGRRIGMGLDRQLQETITSYQSVLEGSFDDRPFNFRPSQGDVLNWIGQRPFIDSRVRLFAAGNPSVVDEHVSLRPSLRIPRDGSSRDDSRDVWQAAFDKYGITHVLPRLSGDQPDYETFRDLSLSPYWTLTRLGAATAVFYRSNAAAAGLQDYVAGNDASDLAQDLLRSREPPESSPAQRVPWPRPPTVYERYLYLPNPSTPNTLQLARHYSALVASGAIEPTLENAVATAYGAIRQTHAALAENPHDRNAYHILGRAYGMLLQIEQSVMQDRGLGATDLMRFRQIVSAYYHALLCDPGDASAIERLFQIFAEQQRLDLALHHLLQMRDLTGNLTMLSESDPNFALEQQRNSEFLLELTADLTAVRQKLEENVAAGADRLMLVQDLAQSGYLLTALETLEDDLTIIAGDPETTFLYAQLLLEVGRTAEAHDQLQGLKSFAEQEGMIDWPTISSFGQIIAEDLTGALSTMQEEHDRFGQSAAALLLQPGPLQAGGTIGPAADGFRTDPLLAVSRRTRSASLYFNEVLPRLEQNELHQALIKLELGDNGAAADLFQSLLDRDPASVRRPIAELYLLLLTDGTDIPPLPPGDDAGGAVPDLFGEQESIDGTRDDAAVKETPSGENKTESDASDGSPPDPDPATRSGPPLC